MITIPPILCSLRSKGLREDLSGSHLVSFYQCQLKRDWTLATVAVNMCARVGGCLHRQLVRVGHLEEGGYVLVGHLPLYEYLAVSVKYGCVGSFLVDVESTDDGAHGLT